MDTKQLGNEVDEIFLGILLNSGTGIYSVLDKVTPTMLDGEPNQVVYRYMVALARNGVDVSKPLLKNELVHDGVFNTIGGDGYLDYLSVKGVNDSNIMAYATAVVENYRRRELVKFGVKLQKMGNIDSMSVISRASAFLNKLSVSGGGDEEVLYLADIVDHAVDAVKERINHPGIQGVTTGFSGIDRITSGYGKGEVWYIGARPGMGKTALLLKSLLSLAKAGTPVLLVNREMYITNLIERMLSMESGIPFSRIRDGYLEMIEVDRIASIRDGLKKLPIYIDNNWSGNEDALISTIRKYHQLKGIRVVGIDYIQLLVERSDESTHELGRLSRNLKLLVGELAITAVILSQLNRKLEERQDKRPMMHDLRQAGSLEEDGDYMIGLYRDEVYRTNSPDSGVLEFIVRKARNASADTIRLGFDGTTVNVYDLDAMPTLRI